ncbi:hypothetical protein LV454_29720, partial [Escherichia coli]|nr:hypothetical protein [Escherichia coli]
PHKPTPPTPTGADGKGYVDDEDYGDEGYGDDGKLDDEITQALSLVNPPPDTPVNKSNRKNTPARNAIRTCGESRA